MSDESRQIEATLGPYRGQRLTVPTADADRAIADGWATDPFAPPVEPKEQTEEERASAIEAAEKAARKLRGEEEGEAKPKAKGPKSETRAMEADAGEPYATREAASTTKKK
jgi:hypothetical protein